MVPIGSQPTKTKPHLFLSAGYLFMFKLGTRPPGMKILFKAFFDRVGFIHINKLLDYQFIYNWTFDWYSKKLQHYTVFTKYGEFYWMQKKCVP